LKAAIIVGGGMVAAGTVAVCNMGESSDQGLSVPYSVLGKDRAMLTVLSKLERLAKADLVAFNRIVIHTDRLMDISIQLADVGEGCAEDRIRAFLEFRKIEENLARLVNSSQVAKTKHLIQVQQKRMLSLLRAHLGAVFILTEH